MKTCTRCKEEKELSDFYKNKNTKDGLTQSCKDCQLEQKKVYHQKNKEKFNKKSKEYYLKNREIELEKRKVYYKENKVRIEKVKKEWYENNKDKVRKNKNEYAKNRRKNDGFWRFKDNIRCMVYSSLYLKGFSKKSKTYEVLGCSYEELKVYIESKFETWMSWDNKGLYNGEPNYGWDIDHIIPLSSAETEEDIIRLNHYTNLQPLCSYVNRYVKSNKY
jgi:hypothetical protein